VDDNHPRLNHHTKGNWSCTEGLPINKQTMPLNSPEGWFINTCA